MDWREALDLVVAHTRHEAYRANCDDDHPQHEAWRARMLSKAAALEGRPVPEYPPFAQQVANAAKAAGRVVATIARAGPVLVTNEEAARRLEICGSCEAFDPAQRRCRLCGCSCAAKTIFQTEECPKGLW